MGGIICNRFGVSSEDIIESSLSLFDKISNEETSSLSTAGPAGELPENYLSPEDYLSNFLPVDSHPTREERSEQIVEMIPLYINESSPELIVDWTTTFDATLRLNSKSKSFGLRHKKNISLCSWGANFERDFLKQIIP